MTLRGNAMGLAVENPDNLKEELNKLPYVQGVTMISTLPGDRFSVEGLIPDVPREADTENPSVRFLRVDEDFIPLMGIDLVEGRNLKRTVGENSEFLLNESAKVALQLENPLGVNARSMLGSEGEIVGVTRDFHYASLHQMIEPLVLEVNYNPDNRGLFYQYMLIKLLPGDLQVMISAIRNKMEELAGGYVMDFTFLEDNLDKNYQAEKRLRDLLRTFAIFAVFISCLGVFGLSSFSAELRTKQTGIRKAMGASVFRIGILMSRNYLGYVVIALVIALPPAAWFMDRWLQNFAYHIRVRAFDFILASLITLFITLLAVSYQVLKSGLSNPVVALRYE
jgi:putative ABC transport system permease protein